MNQFQRISSITFSHVEIQVTNESQLILLYAFIPLLQPRWIGSSQGSLSAEYKKPTFCRCEAASPAVYTASTTAWCGFHILRPF